MQGIYCGSAIPCGCTEFWLRTRCRRRARSPRGSLCTAPFGEARSSALDQIQKPEVIEPLPITSISSRSLLISSKRAGTSSLKSPRVDRLVTVPSITVGDLFAHEAEVDRFFHSPQRMICPHPLLQIYRVIKELRLALVSDHDGNTLLAQLLRLGYYFLCKPTDLGNTP